MAVRIIWSFRKQPVIYLWTEMAANLFTRGVNAELGKHSKAKWLYSGSCYLWSFILCIKQFGGLDYS